MSDADIVERPPSGKLMVRIPKSLHAALREEACDEGVSLNQLMLAKLSVGLKWYCQRKPRK